MNYVIIQLSGSKTTKGAFTYYVITEGGFLKCLCMILGRGRRVGLVMTEENAFLQSEIVFKLSPVVL